MTLEFQNGRYMGLQHEQNMKLREHNTLHAQRILKSKNEITNMNVL